ncbi:MAG: hypothetical protein DELT_03220 [Desulfovibrio sp.]
MRRSLVHVDNGGEDIIHANLPGEKVRRRLEERLHFLPLLSLEKVRACCNQRINKPHAVLSCPAPRRFYPAICFPQI